MSLQLPPLPWPKNSLAPHLSEEAIDYHYGKHHAGYVTKLNGMIPGTEFDGKNVEEIMLKATGAVFNNAAQIWNHTFYWNSMSPKGGGEPTGPVADAINDSFGSYSKFKEEFTAAANGHFGSGWAWLIKKPSGKLAVIGTHDAGNPLRDGQGTPIITADVWEHAYYIDYRNARPSYVDAYWKLINWDWANEQLQLAKAK